MVGAPISSPLPLAFAMASPAARITNVPTLLIHGTVDPIVPYESSVFLAVALSNQNFPVNFLHVYGAGHDLGLANPATSAMILKEVLSWITIYSN